MTKRASLSAFTAKKPGSDTQSRSAEESPQSVQAGAMQKRKGQTLRLTPDAWKQLKFLAIEQERPAHDLLIEAVNDLFQKYGKSSIS